MQPRLIVEQKITAFVNKYRVYATDGAGNKTGLVALAQQKRLAFKEKVLFFDSEAKTNQVFGFRAEKVLDIHGRYFVEDTSGARIGAFRKLFGQSLVVSTWEILDENDAPLFIVRENNATLAALRRFIGFIPIVGDLGELIIMFFRYHFEFVDVSTGAVVGRYQKTTLFRDHYLLSLTDEAYAKDDWRTFAAMGVGLDALQSR